MNATAQIITSLATLVAALGSVLVSLLSRNKIAQVHEATNSKMDKLLKLTESAAFLAGVKSEVDKK